MAEKWFNKAIHNLEGDDIVQSSWPGTYNGKHGYIVLSKERLLFVEEHGLLHHTSHVILNLPYKHITNCTMKPYQLELATTDGRNQCITSPYLSQLKVNLESDRHQTQ